MTSNSLKHEYWNRRLLDKIQTPDSVAVAAVAVPFLFHLHKERIPE